MRTPARPALLGEAVGSESEAHSRAGGSPGTCSSTASRPRGRLRGAAVDGGGRRPASNCCVAPILSTAEAAA